MALLQTVEKQMKEALRAGEKLRLSTLRLIKSELRKIELSENKELDDAGSQAVLKTMAKQHRDSIEQFRDGGRIEMAENEEAELKIIEAFLPESISPEKIDAAIDKVFADLGEIDPKSAGKAIGLVMAALRETGLSFDGKSVSAKVRERLTP